MPAKDDNYIDKRGELDYDISETESRKSTLVKPKLNLRVIVRQTNKIIREVKTAHLIRHALMTLEAEEHYRLLLAIFKEDKEIDDIAKLLYDRKEHVDRVLKESLQFMELSKIISQNKESDSVCHSV